MNQRRPERPVRSGPDQRAAWSCTSANRASRTIGAHSGPRNLQRNVRAVPPPFCSGHQRRVRASGREHQRGPLRPASPSVRTATSGSSVMLQLSAPSRQALGRMSETRRPRACVCGVHQRRRRHRSGGGNCCRMQRKPRRTARAAIAAACPRAPSDQHFSRRLDRCFRLRLTTAPLPRRAWHRPL